ncbi:MAG: hypothetical protein FJ123_00785 [Deltaproteobacteria bacterium]|nr:hypothetical protein [Deltaproteobacteria bacterium]
MICPNPKCGRIVSPFDEKCQHCGTPLESNPVKDYEKKAGQIIKDAESRAEDIKEQIRSGFKDNVSSQRPLWKGHDTTGTLGATRDIEKLRLENIPEIIRQRKKDQLRSWQISYLLEMMNLVFSNPNIFENPAYSEKANRILPNRIIEFDNLEVNGHACLLTEEEIEETKGRFLYEISIYEGYLNFTYAVAATMIDIPGKLGIYDPLLLKSVILKHKEQKANFSMDDLIAVLPEKQEIVGIGPNASAAMFQCIAHELGHICYDHVFSRRRYDFRTSVTNIEMEHHADGFARIIIDRSAFREQLWKGYIQYQIASAALTYYQPEVDLYEPQTHPLRIDRLKEAIKRFQPLATKYKIDEKWAEDTVNKIHEWLS